MTIDGPRQKNRYASANDDVDGQFGGSLSEWTSTAVTSLLLQYSSTCISMPFEVGKMLLQVQWVPKDEVWNNYAQSFASTSDVGGAASRPSRLQQRSGSAHDPFLDQSGGGDDGRDLGDSASTEDLSPEAQEWRRESDRHHADDEDDDDDDEDDGADSDSQSSDLSSPSDVEAYFRDVASASNAQPPSRRRAKAASRGGGMSTDPSGYLVRPSVRRGDSSVGAEFTMPIVVRGGVWEMIKAVARGKEGWYGLWKGTFTTFLYDLLASGIQPTVSAIISPLIPHSLSTLPLPYVPHPKRTLSLLVASHVITHFVLSPLDLIRTRLIVQSTLPRHRKYTGPWDALQKILKEEGGWRTIYGHPHLVIPALLDLTIRPLISLASPLVLERMFRVEANTSPVSYAFAELMINTSTLLFSLPIETVRRRMQVQRRASWGKRVLVEHGSRSTPTSTKSAAFAKGVSSTSQGNSITVRGLRTCVETRPRPYTGVVEAIYRILTEETSQLPGGGVSRGASATTKSAPSAKTRPTTPPPRHRRPQEQPATPSTPANSHPLSRSEIIAPQQPTYATLGGVKSLYRGFTMAAGANLVVFLLTVITGERSHGSQVGGGGGGMSGWSEI